GLSLWSLRNEILQAVAITIVLWGALVAWLGVGVLPFLLLASFWANFQLTSANYVEHSGLLRQRLPDGRYEMCQPHHSWNSNHIFSNWAVFHLQRHSDHHAHPGRRYQSLRHFEDLPQLPSGYFGIFPIAYVPWLWYRIMDPRLLEVTRRDPNRINFDPARRDRLMQRFGLAETS
ncbi:MAG: fatty acid desaturase, partial [Burkholderiaceae bacterium]